MSSVAHNDETTVISPTPTLKLPLTNDQTTNSSPTPTLKLPLANDKTTNTSPTSTLELSFEDQEEQASIVPVVMVISAVIVLLVLLLVLVVIGIVILRLKRRKSYIPTCTLENYLETHYEKGMQSWNYFFKRIYMLLQIWLCDQWWQLIYMFMY